MFWVTGKMRSCSGNRTLQKSYFLKTSFCNDFLFWPASFLWGKALFPHDKNDLQMKVFMLLQSLKMQSSSREAWSCLTIQTRNKHQEDWKRERRALCDSSDCCENYEAIQMHALHLLGDIKDRRGEGFQKNYAGHPDVAPSFLHYFLWVITWNFLLWPALHQNNATYLLCHIFNQWHQRKCSKSKMFFFRDLEILTQWTFYNWIYF